MALPPLVGRTPPIPSLGSSVNALIGLPQLAANISTSSLAASSRRCS
jgi:hypothetical protein